MPGPKHQLIPNLNYLEVDDSLENHYKFMEQKSWYLHSFLLICYSSETTKGPARPLSWCLPLVVPCSTLDYELVAMTKAWLPKCEESAWWNIMWWIYLCIFIMLKDAKSCSMKPHVTRESLWKIHKRWKVRFGVTHLQVDRRKSSVGLGDACKDFVLYVVENLHWISRVNEGCMQTQALKTMRFFFPGSSFQIVIIDPKVLR